MKAKAEKLELHNLKHLPPFRKGHRVPQCLWGLIVVFANGVCFTIFTGGSTDAPTGIPQLIMNALALSGIALHLFGWWWLKGQHVAVQTLWWCISILLLVAAINILFE